MSVRPATIAFAEDSYARLAPVADAMGGDESRGWHLLHLIVAISKMFERVERLARSDDGSPAWRNAVDVDRADDQDLGFVGQLLGVRPVGGVIPDQQRARVRDVGGFKRGRPAALRAAVAGTLTGTQHVVLVERDGSESAFTVITRPSETPATAATVAAIISQKPAGLLPTHVLSEVVTWGEIATTYATWADVAAANATWEDVENG
jgi:hypothetical protein